MAYNKTTWSNGQAPGINDTKLNKIEQGIYDNSVNIGELNNLDTTEKSNLVGAVNEVQGNVNNTNTNIGNLSNLDTTEKSSLVGAINELKEDVDGIIESGSNANGNYIKYADGTMITYQKITGSINISTSWGSLYRSNEISMTNFPISFISIPTVNTYAVASGSSQFWQITGESNQATVSKAGNIALMRPTSASDVPYQINIIAIGKWK